VPGAGLGGHGDPLGDLRRPERALDRAAADGARRRGAAGAGHAPAPVAKIPRRADGPCVPALPRMRGAGLRPGDRPGDEQQERRSMDRDPRSEEDQDADWIFAIDDPHSLPTDRLPGREEFDRYAQPLLARRGQGPALPDQDRPGAEPDAVTGAIPAVDGEEDGSDGTDDGTVAPLARPRVVSYARSGTTPNAEDDEIPIAGFQLPERFKDLGLFDALRDVLALVCLTAALTTVFTSAHNPRLDLLGKVAIGIALAALAAVPAPRWIPAEPPLPVLRVLRVAGMAPALLVAVLVLGADLVLSLPVLFAPLPDGAPVGIGAGVSLLLLGAILGIEPRAHEGYLPQERARRAARRLRHRDGTAAAAASLLELVYTE